MNDPHQFGTEFGSDHALEQRTPIVSHHDVIKWFEAIPGEQLCIRVHGTQVNGRYACGVEELYPTLVGLSLEELSTVVEPFGSGIVGPPIDE